jgi:glycosyltransferase involved in cell wall biosynthesis
MRAETEAASELATPHNLNTRKLRVLMLCSHPTQYSSPLWRRMAQDSRLDMLVAYCSLKGAEAHVDPDFGVEVAWDVPLLDGYQWEKIPNALPRRISRGFLSLINPGVGKLIQRGQFDAVLVFTGYMCATFWIALTAAKLAGIPILYGADATTLYPQDGRGWKVPVKKILWPRIFALADVVLVPSSGTAALMRSLKIPPKRMQLTPYVVDNDWWTAMASRVDRGAVRKNWNIPEDASVILFCAKLQPWKRPQDLLQAFAKASIPDSYLVFAGDGAMRRQLERQAAELKIQGRVRFLGFVNQSALPGIYCSSDVMVLPSEYEAFGVVVNESMLCGCPVIASDRVGARLDLIRDGETGFVYSMGDIDMLSAVLRRAFSCGQLKQMGAAARDRMAAWSPEMNAEGTIEAIKKAIQFKGGRARK